MSLRTPTESFYSLASDNYRVVQSLVSLVSAVFFGLYFSILPSKFSGQSIYQLFGLMWNLGFWNIFLIFGCIAFLLNTYIASIPPTLLKKMGKNLIENILEAACKSLILQNNENNRALVLLINDSTETMTTRYSYNEPVSKLYII